MTDQQIGFNELVRRLNISPTQASNIQNGRANLTLLACACATTKTIHKIQINIFRPIHILMVGLAVLTR